MRVRQGKPVDKAERKVGPRKYKEVLPQQFVDTALPSEPNIATVMLSIHTVHTLSEYIRLQ